MQKLGFVLSAGLALGLVAAPAAQAKSAWTQTVTVKASDWDPLVSPGGVSVLVVGAGETILLTDVVVTHNVVTTSSTFRANLRRGPASNPTPCATASLVLSPFVAPLETESINLSSAIEFQAGEQLCIVVGGAAGTDGLTFNLVGIKLP